VVPTIESLGMTALIGHFRPDDNIHFAGAKLDPGSPNHGRVRHRWLWLDPKQMPEEIIGRLNAEESLAKIDKNGNLKDRIRVQVNQFDLVKSKKLAQKIAGGQTQTLNKKRSWFGIGCPSETPSGAPITS
jgi:hypothetical protein